jgi:hypothetical protein
MRIKKDALPLILLLGLTFLLARPCRAEESKAPMTSGAERAQKLNQILDEGLEQSRKQAMVLKAAEEQNTRFNKYLNDANATLAKQDRLLSRFDRILDTWEKQQKQYQAYLDRLTKTGMRIR